MAVAPTGILLVNALMDEVGSDVVVAYMQHIMVRLGCPETSCGGCEATLRACIARAAFWL